MSFELEIDMHALYVLPAFIISEGGCECCDEVAGWVVSFSWLFFSFNIYIDAGNGGRHV